MELQSSEAQEKAQPNFIKSTISLHEMVIQQQQQKDYHMAKKTI